MISLDTNAIVAVQSGRFPLVRARLEEALRATFEIAVSSVVLFELRYGAAKSGRPARNQEWLDAFLGRGFPIIEFDGDDACEAGRLRAELETAGTPIGHYDVLIAAQARRRNATLVTANVREFSRVHNLVVIDWSQV